jgi:hypothetical protein
MMADQTPAGGPAPDGEAPVPDEQQTGAESAEPGPATKGRKRSTGPKKPRSGATGGAKSPATAGGASGTRGGSKAPAKTGGAKTPAETSGRTKTPATEGGALGAQARAAPSWLSPAGHHPGRY